MSSFLARDVSILVTIGGVRNAKIDVDSDIISGRIEDGVETNL